jgi:hypothetical protein
MNARQGKAYLAIVKNAQDRFQYEIEELADKIRTEVIIPLCRKYHLRFVSGMGTFFFVDTDDHYYEDPYPHLASRASKGNLRIYNATQPVLLMLAQEVSHNQCLGYYIADVRE